ncbi:MAG TPA: multidrug transporter, partial [Planctomycetaceae bacterium]|nr:multidrug transporter [Planctomycetaceae bacterium]
NGYDQMVREMLAGDEVAPNDPQALAATGFLARSWYKFNRTSWLDNTIEHTAKAFMGLTINCAKCHDHKYDPITHLDYYKFRAIFEPYQVRVDALPGDPDLT